MQKITVPNKPGKGLYSGNFYHCLLDGHGLVMPLSVNPIQANAEIKNEASIFQDNYQTDKLNALRRLFERICCLGQMGIEYDYTKYRKNGCFTAEEVVANRRGCCIEETYLFLSVANQAGLNQEMTSALGFLVLRKETGVMDWHACPGILVENLDGNDKHLEYYRFREDPDFRKMVLKIAGREDAPNLSMLLLDLTVPLDWGFGAQHPKMVLMSDSHLLASYFVNSGAHFYLNGAAEKGRAQWQNALKIFPEDTLVLNNLATDAFERRLFKDVLLHTKNFHLIENPKVLIHRADAWLELASMVDMPSVLRAVQKDNAYESSYIALAHAYSDIGFLGEAKKTLALAAQKLERIMEDEINQSNMKAFFADSTIPQNQQAGAPDVYREYLHYCYKKMAEIDDLIRERQQTA